MADVVIVIVIVGVQSPEEKLAVRDRCWQSFFSMYSCHFSFLLRTGMISTELYAIDPPCHVKNPEIHPVFAA
jgi:hypothetical protein